MGRPCAENERRETLCHCSDCTSLSTRKEEERGQARKKIGPNNAGDESMHGMDLLVRTVTELLQ